MPSSSASTRPNKGGLDGATLFVVFCAPKLATPLEKTSLNTSDNKLKLSAEKNEGNAFYKTY